MLRNLNKKAVLFFIFAWFNFSIMEVTAKYLSFKYPITEVIWIRFFSQTIVLFLIFFPFIKTKLVTHSLYLHISRGVCLFFAALFFFIGFTKTDLANATAIYKTSPIFLTLGSIFFLKETNFLVIKFLTVFLALIGALIIINPSSSSFSIYSFFPLFAAISLAIFGLITRYFGERENPLTSIIYTALSGTILSSFLFAFFDWKPFVMQDIPFFVVIGTVSTLGHFLLIKAFQIEEASNLASFSTVVIFFNTLWGILLFSEYPSINFYIGSILIILSFIILFRNISNFKTLH